MVRRCEVSGCPVRQGKGLRLFYFPKCEKRRLLWQSWVKVNRPGWSPKTNSCICELHFAPTCYEKRQDGKKILKNTAIPSLQKESLENIENIAEHLKSLPETFETSKTRVGLSDITNFLEAKKSNCSTSASSEILPSQVSFITDSIAEENTENTETENTENSLMWFAHLCSQFESINNISSSNSNSFLNESMPIEITQSLSSCPINNSSVENDKSIIQSSPTENVSTQTNIFECDNVSTQTNTFQCDNVSVSTDNSVTIIEALKKEIVEKNKRIETFEKQLDIIKKSTEKVYKMYFDTKRKYAAHYKQVKRLTENKNKIYTILRKKLYPDQIEALRRKSNNGLKWSSVTMKDALVFKMK
ncbi:uncharacterized protein [Temnothorax nylanderi]|uniref:uncharacterized protein isoform X1 n=1 Tax=Temnothorax nylanderi TaxID=102681 RepID=UPI003A8A968B